MGWHLKDHHHEVDWDEWDSELYGNWHHKMAGHNVNEEG